MRGLSSSNNDDNNNKTNKNLKTNWYSQTQATAKSSTLPTPKRSSKRAPIQFVGIFPTFNPPHPPTSKHTFTQTHTHLLGRTLPLQQPETAAICSVMLAHTSRAKKENFHTNLDLSRGYGVSFGWQWFAQRKTTNKHSHARHTHTGRAQK